MHIRGDILADCLLAVASLVFYAWSLYPGVGGTSSPGDAAKFQCVGMLVAIPHAPGFPLYVMASAVWGRLFGCFEPAIAQNLLSAAWAACALVLFRRAAQTMGAGIAASVLGACSLGVGIQFWLDATEAGPASMNCAILAAVLWLLIHGAASAAPRALAAAIGIALAASGQDTVFLVLLPVVVLLVTVLDRAVWLRRATWIACAVGVGCIVLQYALVWVRMRAGASMEFLHRGSSLNDVALFALGAQFWTNWWQAGPRDILVVRMPWLAVELIRQAHTIGAALAVLGVVWLVARARRMALVLCVPAVVATAWSMHQYSVRIEANYWPVYLCVALLCTAGLDLVIRVTRAWWPAVAALFVAAVTISVSAHQGGMIGRQPAFAFEEHLLAVPRKAVWATFDKYTSQEVLRYYAAINPFIARRNIVASDDPTRHSYSTVFFIGEPMREEVVRQGGIAEPLYSNGTTVCYLARGRKP